MAKDSAGAIRDFFVELGFDGSKVYKGLKDLTKEFEKVDKAKRRRASRETNELKKQNTLARKRLTLQKQIDKLKASGSDVRGFYNSKRSNDPLKIDAAIIKANEQLHELTKSTANVKARSAEKVAKAEARSDKSQKKRLSIEKRISKIRFNTSLQQKDFQFDTRKFSGFDKDPRNKEYIKQLKEVKALEKSISKQLNTAKSEKDLDRLERTYRTLTRAMIRTKKAGNEVNRTFRANSFTAKALQDSLRNLARSYVSVFAVMQGGGAFVRVGQDLISQGHALKAATGSVEAAGEAFEFVKETSLNLGLNLSSATKGFTQLQAAARLAGMRTEDVQNSFLGVAEASATFGLSTVDQERALRAITQMMNKGQVTSEEMKLQLAEALPGALEIAAQSMGMIPKEFLKAMEQGQVITSEFLPKFSEKLREVVRAGGGLEAGMNSSRVAMARFSTTLQLNVFDSFLSGAEEGLASFFNSLTDIMDNAKPLFKFLGSLIGVLSKLIGIVMQVSSQALRPFSLLLEQLVGVTKDAEGNVNMLGGAFALLGAVLLTPAAMIERLIDYISKMEGATGFLVKSLLALGAVSAALFKGGKFAFIFRMLTGLQGVRVVLLSIIKGFKRLASMFGFIGNIANKVKGIGKSVANSKLSKVVAKQGAKFAAKRALSAPVNAVPVVGQAAWLGMAAYDLYDSYHAISDAMKDNKAPSNKTNNIQNTIHIDGSKDVQATKKVVEEVINEQLISGKQDY